MPFIYKRTVFEAAVMSSLLYSSETWLKRNTKALEKQYNRLVKCLLGVRKNTSMNLCMIEADIPPVQHLIEKKRYKFIKRKHENIDMQQPYHFVYNLCRDANTPGFRFIERSLLWNSNENPLDNIATYVRERMAGATKLATYITELNPSMTMHQVYRTMKFIPDYKRESFTRLRLMSHSLRIEVGRWSRTPTDQRVCQCDGQQVQTEQHVMIHCPLSALYRV